ncbi:MAG: glycine cleavage system protein R [Pseudohongiella sp.]|nr:MAG: glycine cleavage system protein R [Pseudohongiella sp.]
MRVDNIHEQTKVEGKMTSNLVLTVIADDKPGLVESLSQTIASNSGNWLESSMSQLAGKFAGILRVSVADGAEDKLIAELNGLSSEIRLVIEKAADESEEQPSRMVELSLVGNDRPGIIKEISAVVSTLGVNVQRLNTECTPAPMSSDSLFKAKAILAVPEEVTLEQLQEKLELLADDLIVEVEVLVV